MFDIALSIFLLLSPIILLPAIGNITALQFYQFGIIDSTNSLLQLQFFQFGVIGLFIVSLFQKKVREYKDLWLSLFLVGCLVNIFLHPIAIKMSVNIFLGFILYKLVVEHTRNIKLVLIPIAIVCILNSIFAVLQYFNVHLIYNDLGRIDGLMKLSSHLGTYQALSVPILYMFNPVLAIIPLVGLMLSKTSTAIVGVIVGMAYLFKRQIFDNLNALFVMFCMSLSVLLMLFIFKNRVEISRELFTRIWIWRETVTNLSFTGVGFSSFNKVYPNATGNFFMAVYPGEIFKSIYSTYLYIIHSLGVFSIPIFIWIYKQFKVRNQDRLSRCLFVSCLTLLIIGLGQSFIEFPRLAGTAIVIFGLLKIKQGGVNGYTVKV